MLRHLYVAVDASEHSNAAVELAVELARACRARLTACHVYAGRLHDARFRQMEHTLPDRYREEVELERQRTVHASLIQRGLHLISESYLHEPMARARDAGLACEPRVLEGRHWQALVEDVGRSDSDLVVLGALGMGAVGDSLLGSVTERFVRHTSRDTLVVRTLDPTALGDAAIVVGLDGSARSWRALQVALGLSRVFGRRVEALAVHDPYLHYALFKRIVGVLPPEEARTFRFKEQEQLHEEIIDSGLARIYQSHLDVARRLAAAEGVDLTTHLLAGKAFERILHHCRTRPPWLLVLGRAGFHSDSEAGELGATSENLLRLAPCNVLLTAGRFDLPDDVRAQGTIAWTTEAEACMARVPGGVRGMARAAVLRYATEQGHTAISSRLATGSQSEQRPPAEVPVPAAAPAWTADALARLERVPAGFMREATRQEVERAAAASGVASVDLALCETVIARLRATTCRGGAEPSR